MVQHLSFLCKLSMYIKVTRTKLMCFMFRVKQRFYSYNNVVYFRSTFFCVKIMLQIYVLLAQFVLYWCSICTIRPIVEFSHYWCTRLNRTVFIVFRLPRRIFLRHLLSETFYNTDLPCFLRFFSEHFNVGISIFFIYYYVYL